MTQVITVSAPTAAYAASAQRPPPGRPLTASPLENTIREWRTKAIENGDPGQKAVLSLVKPPALALLFLTMPARATRRKPLAGRDAGAPFCVPANV
jgi:hypothetical protein